MKIMKSYPLWIPIGAIPVALISGVILYFPAAVQLYKIHWLALLAVLVIACGPWGKRQVTDTNPAIPRYRFGYWLAQIVILQLCLGAVFLGISAACGEAAPVLTIPQPQLFHPTLNQLLISEGLFPWALIALIAVGMDYYSYQRGQDAYLATLFNPIIQQNLAKIIINFLGRLATLWAYASTFCLISLLWASLISISPIITGFELTPLLLSIILIIGSRTKIYRRNLLKSLGKDVPFMLGVFLWVVFLAVAIWLINGFLALIIHATLKPPGLLNYWLSQPWQRLWLIFANSWWLLWMPIAGITLARISRGYSARAMIAGILGFPLTIALILELTQHFNWEIRPPAAAIAAAIGLFGLLWMTLHKKAAPSFILTYLPRRDHYKFRSYHSAFIKVTQMSVGFLFIYLPSGLAVIHFLIFAVTWPLLMIGLGIMLCHFFRLAYRQRP